MADQHAMTLRLDTRLAEDLATVASVDGTPVAEVVRAAVDAYLARRIADPEFRAALQRRIERIQRLSVGAHRG